LPLAGFVDIPAGVGCAAERQVSLKLLQLHEESAEEPVYCPFQFHPYISGRPGRGKALRTIIQHMKAADGVWFATGSEVAQWCLDHVFKEDRSRIAKAS
jgi:hypothetical protein